MDIRDVLHRLIDVALLAGDEERAALKAVIDDEFEADESDPGEDAPNPLFAGSATGADPA